MVVGAVKANVACFVAVVSSHAAVAVLVLAAGSGVLL
jgi:hypothetical protein